MLVYQKELIGVKGHIRTHIIEDDEEIRKKVMEVVADKVTFLSSKSKD